MKLTPDTQINAIVFIKKGTDTVLMSSDMNMKFSQYDKLARGMTQSMLGLRYDLQSVTEREGLTFFHYSHNSDQYHAQYVEIVS